MQTPGPLVLSLSSKSIILRHLSIAQVLSRLCLPDFFNLFLGKVNGCRVILLLLILYNTLVTETELLAKDRKYDDLLPYLTCRGTRAYSKRVPRTNYALRIKKCLPRISSDISFFSTS